MGASGGGWIRRLSWDGGRAWPAAVAGQLGPIGNQLSILYVVRDVRRSEGSHVPRKDRVMLCGRIGLVLASLIITGGVIAEPLLRSLWTSQVTVAQR
jgi:hypothetical protein